MFFDRFDQQGAKQQVSRSQIQPIWLLLLNGSRISVQVASGRLLVVQSSDVTPPTKSSAFRQSKEMTGPSLLMSLSSVWTTSGIFSFFRCMQEPLVLGQKTTLCCTESSSWITLILDIWVAASWLFTRHWCCAPTLRVQCDLGLFHSGHVFFFLCSHAHGKLSGWFKGILFNYSSQKSVFVWTVEIEYFRAQCVSVGPNWSRVHCWCLVLCLLQKKTAAALYNLRIFSFKPIEATPTLCFEIHQEVFNKKKEQYRIKCCLPV